LTLKPVTEISGIDEDTMKAEIPNVISGLGTDSFQIKVITKTFCTRKVSQV
jgi:hypothetical protein